MPETARGFFSSFRFLLRPKDRPGDPLSDRAPPHEPAAEEFFAPQPLAPLPFGKSGDDFEAAIPVDAPDIKSHEPTESLVGFDRFGIRVDKITATKVIAATLNQPDAPVRGEGVELLLDQAAKRFAAAEPFRFMASAEVDTAHTAMVFQPGRALLGAPAFTNGRPDCFSRGTATDIYQDGLGYLSLPDGYFCHFAGFPLTLAADGVTIVTDFSSRYAQLSHFYDCDLVKILGEATRIEGVAIAITDDIRPLNYSHWICDTLSRLAITHGLDCPLSMVHVICTAHRAAFQEETLAACGIDRAKIVWLDEFKAVQADVLLVPSDLKQATHPAHKGARWAIDFLRGRLLKPGAAFDTTEGVYISRGDAKRRRIVNEAALIEQLERRGYRSVCFTGMTVAQQAFVMSQARRVIAPHGAGLSNIVFCPAETSVTEIFAPSYGTPAFYILAAASGFHYRTFIGELAVHGDRPQADDIYVDVDQFIEVCGSSL